MQTHYSHRPNFTFNMAVHLSWMISVTSATTKIVTAWRQFHMHIYHHFQNASEYAINYTMHVYTGISWCANSAGKNWRILPQNMVFMVFMVVTFHTHAVVFWVISYNFLTVYVLTRTGPIFREDTSTLNVKTLCPSKTSISISTYQVTWCHTLLDDRVNLFLSVL